MQAAIVHSPSLPACAHNSSLKPVKENFASVFSASRKPKQQRTSGTALVILTNGEPTSSSPPSSSPSLSTSRAGKNVFLLDVAPLCYRGKKPSPSALIGWLKPFFFDVTCTQPIIADMPIQETEQVSKHDYEYREVDQVLDGERGNEYRKGLLPTYKRNRNAFVPLSESRTRQTWRGDDADLREAFPVIKSFLTACHVPVISLEDSEADDVIASLTEQAVQKGMRVSIASPDKDFKQLLRENVQIVVPLVDLKRWSFYTHRQYVDQHGFDPKIELSLRCLLGDKADCIPGLAEIAPGFGRKTALKLLKKHGSLENLLHEASRRTVGKPYVQDALTQNAPTLWKNLEVLSLRRDLPIRLREDWCVARDNTNDTDTFSELEKQLQVLQTRRARRDGIVKRDAFQQTRIRSSKREDASKGSIGFEQEVAFSSD